MHSAELSIQELNHEKFHIEELQRIYSDLQVERHSDGKLTYFSEQVNPTVTDIHFSSCNISNTYAKMHTASFYKEVKINCIDCSNIDIVSSLPLKIPILIIFESGYQKIDTIMTADYYNLFEQHSIPKEMIQHVNLYNSEFVKNNKTNNLYINSAVKSLLVFA